MKLVDWLKKAKDLAETGQIDQIAERGRSIIAMSEIFTEDDEWAKELMDSGVVLTYLAFTLRNYEDLKENTQNQVKETIGKYMDQAIDSVNLNDWLKFHKSFRNMLFELNQLA